jgi:hypothetical protein
MVATAGPRSLGASTITAPPRRRIWERVESQARAVVVAFVALLALPYLVRGPALIADDFIWLRNARFGGWLAAGGPRALSRPGELLGTNLIFGLLGPRPLLLYAVQVALWMVAALAVLGCLRRLLGLRVALVVTLLWLWIPNHVSLEHWSSTWQIWAAIALLAFGVSRLIDSARAGKTSIIGLFLIAGSITFYELTVGIAVVAVVVGPWYVAGRFQRRTAVLGVALCGAAALWSLVAGTTYPGGASGSLTVSWVLSGVFSLGFAPWSKTGRLVMTVVSLLMVVVLFDAVRRADRHLRQSTKLLMGGMGIIVLGVLPLANFQTNFYGLYDRSNAVSSIGVAMVLTALALWIRDFTKAKALMAPRLSIIAGCGFGLVMTLALAVGAFQRISWNRTYHQQGADAVSVVRELGEGMQQIPILVNSRVADEPRFAGLIDGWNASAALQLKTGDQRAVVWVVGDCIANGPPVDRPGAAYGSAPFAHRMLGCTDEPTPPDEAGQQQ